MKNTHYSAFFAIFFLYKLIVVAADTWYLSLICGSDLEIKLEHRNNLGLQVIRWNTERTSSDTMVCSDDGIVCLRGTVFTRIKCNNVAIDFEVRYANTWSKSTRAFFTGIHDSGYGYIGSDPYFFNPIFV